jgi:hypothetical protein
VQRCQGHDRVRAIAFLRPSWASETTSSTPVRPRHERPQKLAPERLSLRCADVEADDLPASRLVHGVRDNHALRHHATAISDLLDLGVEEQIGIAALQGTLAKRFDLLVEQTADARHLRARGPQPERLHQLVDTAGRDPAHIGLLDDRHQRLLTAFARLQEAREVTALPELRDLQLDLAGTRVPTPRPIAVAVRRAVIGTALAELGPDQLRHLHLHQLAHQQLQRLAQHIRVLIQQHLPDDLLGRHPVGTGHQWCLLRVEPSASPTMVSAAVAGTTFRPKPSYTTLWDATSAACRSTRRRADRAVRAKPRAAVGSHDRMRGYRRGDTDGRADRRDGLASRWPAVLRRVGRQGGRHPLGRPASLPTAGTAQSPPSRWSVWRARVRGRSPEPRGGAGRPVRGHVAAVRGRRCGRRGGARYRSHERARERLTAPEPRLTRSPPRSR